MPCKKETNAKRNKKFRDMKTEYALFEECPICNKKYDKYWKIFVHIKKSKDVKHQSFLKKNIQQALKIYLDHKGNVFEFFKKLYNAKNIFAAISNGYVLNMFKNELKIDNMEDIRRRKISREMKKIPKTADHNKNVSLAVKQAWKDGKFDTDDCKKARAKGYKNRRSFSGKGNPMYGKPSPKGSGRGKGGIRVDIGHYVRSTWEANMARIYQKFNRQYKYETKRFYIKLGNDSFSYCPDFYFLDKNRYYEIKGHAKSSEEWICPCKTCVKNRAIMKEVVKKFGVKITLVGKKEYDMIKRRFKDEINWEK